MTSIGLRPIRPRYSLAFAAAAFMTGLSVIGGASASASPSQTDPEPQVIPLNFDSRIADISDEDLAAQALATLNAPRGWKQAGISYTSDPASDYQVILAEPAEVDALCDPIGTGGRVSCQNSNVVALNANRWRSATSDWDQSLEDYRHYLYNHEVGHLSGQFHPANRCPVPGEPEAVMAQQTKGLEGCTGNAWPLDWEIERAKERPLVLAPAPNVEPAQRGVNPGGGRLPQQPNTEESAPATTEVPAASPPNSGAEPVPKTAAADEAEQPATSAPPDDALGEAAEDETTTTTPQIDVTVTTPADGTNPLLIVGALVGALCLGGMLITLIARSRRRSHHDEDAVEPLNPDIEEDATAKAVGHQASRRTPSLHDVWRLQVAGGSTKRPGLAWYVPDRWPVHDANSLGDTVQLLGPAPPPGALFEAISKFLKAQPHLAPR